MGLPFEVVTGKVVHDAVFSDLAGCVEVVRRAYLAHFEGRTVNPPSQFLRYPKHSDRRIIALPAHLDDGASISGIKWIASFPENTKKGLARAAATLILNDADNGYPIACLEGSIISASRTAASATLAARQLLGAAHVHRIGIVGTGLVAGYVYQFLQGTGWTFDEVCLFDADRNAAACFARAVERRQRDVVVHVADDVRAVIAASELLVFATTAGRPHVHHLPDFAHRPVVLHLSLRDIAPSIIVEAQNVVDDVSHVLAAGTSLHLAEPSGGKCDWVAGTLGDALFANLERDRNRPCIFSPFGLGLLDLAVGKWVYDRAKANGATILVKEFFHDVSRWGGFVDDATE